MNHRTNCLKLAIGCLSSCQPNRSGYHEYPTLSLILLTPPNFNDLSRPLRLISGNCVFKLWLLGPNFNLLGHPSTQLSPQDALCPLINCTSGLSTGNPLQPTWLNLPVIGVYSQNPFSKSTVKPTKLWQNPCKAGKANGAVILSGISMAPKDSSDWQQNSRSSLRTGRGRNVV